MTFQELVDEMSLDTIFLNTSVDVATQNALLEWFFDYDLADDDTSKWLRYFRRRCNDIYPKYKDLVRVMSVKSNLDPFITEFMERIHTSSDVKNLTLTIRDRNVRHLEYGKRVDTTDVKTVQPHTTKTEEFNNVRDIHDRGANGVKSTTTYTNYREDTLGSVDGGSTDKTSGNPYQTSAAVENNSQGRGVSIAYPEANMGSIGSGVNGGTDNIGYASSENRSWQKDNLGATRVDQKLDEKVTNTHNESNESHKTINGTHAITETGTDTTTRSGSIVTSMQGSDYTNAIKGVVYDGTDSTTDDGTKTHTGSDTVNGRDTDIQQGRHGVSPAEILPKAVQAIIGSDEIQYLISSMQVCFDCYGRL